MIPKNPFRSIAAGFGCALLVAQLGCFPASAKGDPHFDLLNTRTATYTNVTVTFEAKSYILISHSHGMANVKVADLSPDVLHTLGYAAAPASHESPVSTAAPATTSAGNSLGVGVAASAATGANKWQKILLAQEARLRPLVQQWLAKGKGYIPNRVAGTTLILLVAGVVFCHLFSSYCFMLICRKARAPADGLVWLPLLRLIPMLRAAGMSPWWFLAAFIPVLNVLAFLVWCVRIVRVCSKSPVFTVFLIPPVINVPAFIYLAFSPGPAPAPTRKFVSMALAS